MAIELISKIKPKGGTFPMVDAEDVLMPDGSRLSDIEKLVTNVVNTVIEEALGGEY